MVKKKRNQFDFARLRLAAIEAIDSLAADNKDALVAYLREQAQQKPTAFLSLLIKLAQSTDVIEDKEKYKKVTRIELVVPKDTVMGLDIDAKENFE